MGRVSSRDSSRAFLDDLERELCALPVHHNPFLEAFQRGLTRDQLSRFVRQWYVFGIQFRKILIGLLYNVSDREEAVGLELMRVLYSEYGQGRAEEVHAAQLLRLTDRLGIPRSELAAERLCPEAQDYIDTVGEFFLRGDLPTALGASFGIETTAGLVYRHLYGGLLTDPGLSLEDIRFFETHLFEELQHGDWLRVALARYADVDLERDRIRIAAFLAMEKWRRLWDGMDRHVLGRSREAAGA